MLEQRIEPCIGTQRLKLRRRAGQRPELTLQQRNRLIRPPEERVDIREASRILGCECFLQTHLPIPRFAAGLIRASESFGFFGSLAPQPGADTACADGMGVLALGLVQQDQEVIGADERRVERSDPQVFASRCSSVSGEPVHLAEARPEIRIDGIEPNRQLHLGDGFDMSCL